MDSLFSGKLEISLCIASIFFLLLVTTDSIPAFGQASEFGDEMNDMIKGGIDQATDKFVDNIDLSSSNPLNVTEDETKKLTDSSKGLFFVIIELFHHTHEFSMALINFLSPYTVDGLILLLIAGAITVVLALSLLKRLAVHVLIITVITLVVIAIIVIFYF